MVLGWEISTRFSSLILTRSKWFKWAKKKTVKVKNSQKRPKTNKELDVFLKECWLPCPILVKDLEYDRIETTIFIHRAVFFSSSCTHECPVVAFGNRYAGWVGVYISPQIPSDEEAVWSYKVGPYDLFTSSGYNFIRMKSPQLSIYFRPFIGVIDI